MKLDDAIKLLDIPMLPDYYGKITIKSNIKNKYLVMSHEGVLNVCTNDWPHPAKIELYKDAEDWEVDNPTYNSTSNS